MGFFYNGGGERTVLREAIGLRDRGFEVDVFAPTVSDRCFPELISKVKVEELCGWMPQRIIARNMLGMVLSSLLTPRLARRFEGYETVLAHGQPSNWIAHQIKKRHDTPYIAYLHQVNRLLYPREIDTKVGWGTNREIQLLEVLHKRNEIIRKLDNLTIKDADIVLTNSEWIREKIQQTYRVDARTCHPGVEPNLFKKPYPEEGSKQRYILTTNRHYPQKRLDLILSTVHQVAKTLPEVKAVITGEHTRYTDALTKMAENLGIAEKVEFTGNLKAGELVETYQGAYLYTYTSPEEDFGLGPLEAAACGVPSIVWDHAGPKETVIHGETGLRVEPYDMSLFVDSHLRLLQDEGLRDEMGEKAQRHVSKNFTWEKHVDQLAECLDGVA